MGLSSPQPAAGIVKPAGSSPGRGEGLPIFLPLNGESWRCFHCAGQSDSLPNFGLHYWGLALVHSQPAKSRSTTMQQHPCSVSGLQHKAFLITSLVFCLEWERAIAVLPLEFAINNIHSPQKKSSLYQSLLQISTAWCCTPARQLNPSETATQSISVTCNTPLAKTVRKC